MNIMIAKNALGFSIAVLLVLASACATSGKVKISDFFEPGIQRDIAEAAAKGRIQDVEKLIDKGARINYQGNEGMTALVWTFMRQNKKGYQYLLERGADPNLQVTKSIVTSDGIIDGQSAISLAAMHREPWHLEITLKHGGNPSLVNPVNHNPVIFGCIVFFDEKYRMIEQLKLLIAAGVDLNSYDRFGSTPMMTAALLNRYDMVYIMLEAGADPRRTAVVGIGSELATRRAMELHPEYDWENIPKPQKPTTTLLDMIKRARTSPEHEMYQWRTKVIDLLIAKGIDAEWTREIEPRKNTIINYKTR